MEKPYDESKAQTHGSYRLVVRILVRRGIRRTEGAGPCGAAGLDVSPIRVDLTKNETIDDAIADMDRSGRSVEMLVNNAGILHEKPLLDLTDSEIADSIAVHLTGPIRLIRLATPAMVRRGFGRIVNISSGWGAFAEGMGGQSAPRTPESAADTAVWLATLPGDGPTGGFFRDRKPIPW